MASLVIFMLLECRDLRDRMIEAVRSRAAPLPLASPQPEDGAFVNRLARAADGLPDEYSGS